MSKVIRSVKNVTKGYSSAQVKVREATSNDPWGPTGTQMSEIAQMTFNGSAEFYDIVDMLDKRLNDKGKNWRHVLKALKVLDYCLHEGAESVVTWARQNIYIIKTLREFQYIDEEGRDVGQNVRVAAKELTSLILDEERLRSERSDRKTWKSRVTGIEEFGPSAESSSSQRRPRERPHNYNEEDDTEYRLAIEASLNQEEEDRRKRESRSQTGTEDDDLAKAIKLSREEEERRQRELEESKATSLFDDTPVQTSQPQYTGFNQGYQQGSAVDFFANPIDSTQVQQPTGYMGTMYTGYPQQHLQQTTGFQNGFSNGFGTQPNNAFDPYGQQGLQQMQPPQQTAFNPYAQQQPQQQSQQQLQPESTLQPGSNNPWATHSMQQLQSLQPPPTGSNNPFASSFNRPQSTKPPTLGSLPEQQPLSNFGQPTTASFSPQTSFSQPNQTQPQIQPQPQLQTQKELSEHEAKLNALLATGDGMDTFGNTGNLRIPAQHTAPGTFINSAGAGLNRITAEPTGSNPFLRQQMTGMPSVSYGSQMPTATGPMGMNGFGGQPANNPFAPRQQQPNNQGDLIQF